MSNENPGSPVATATPGSPIYLSLNTPSAPEVKAPAESPEKASKRSAKAEKLAAKESDAQRAKGARSVLKGLGVPKEERDGLLREIKETRTAKSLQEKLTGEHKSRAEKAEGELALLKSKVGAYETLAKQYADDQFNALDESAQKFIAKQAGDSLEKRLEIIAALKESGMLTKQEAAAATAQVKTAVNPVKPATTSLATNPKAPPPAGTPGPKEAWQQMREEARAEPDHGRRIARERMAAAYYAANQISIDSEL